MIDSHSSFPTCLSWIHSKERVTIWTIPELQSCPNRAFVWVKATLVRPEKKLQLLYSEKSLNELLYNNYHTVIIMYSQTTLLANAILARNFTAGMKNATRKSLSKYSTPANISKTDCFLKLPVYFSIFTPHTNNLHYDSLLYAADIVFFKSSTLSWSDKYLSKDANTSIHNSCTSASATPGFNWLNRVDDISSTRGHNFAAEKTPKPRFCHEQRT